MPIVNDNIPSTATQVSGGKPLWPDRGQTNTQGHEHNQIQEKTVQIAALAKNFSPGVMGEEVGDGVQALRILARTWVVGGSPKFHRRWLVVDIIFFVK
jgi:hypothetical protein